MQEWTSLFAVNSAKAPRDQVLRVRDWHSTAGELDSTTVYDALDRPTDSYGPGTPAELGTSYTSGSAPRSQTFYDEGFQGLAARWFSNKEIKGAPSLYTTFNGDQNWGTGSPTNTGPFPGVTLSTDNWSGTASGRVTGTGVPIGVQGDAARLYVDDIKVGDTWGGAYRSAVMTDAPAGYWRLGETAGTTATDETGTVPGTYASVTLNQLGALATGQGADPDPGVTMAAAGGIAVPLAAGAAKSTLNFTGDMAVEAWIKPTSHTAWRMIACKRRSKTGAELT
jgi:hypothetical protein